MKVKKVFFAFFCIKTSRSPFLSLESGDGLVYEIGGTVPVSTFTNKYFEI